MKIEVEAECKSCKGTGLYVGMYERNGAAIVCHICKGTGRQKITVEYEPFHQRKHRKGIIRVLQHNPGIGVGVNQGEAIRLIDFGGISYAHWEAGTEFPNGSEMRRFTCPTWWYQSVDYSKKPDWNECGLGGMFSACEHFAAKDKCWKRWDAEYITKES